MSRKILITGGYGFIGSNLIKAWMTQFPGDQVLNLDACTYAARPEYLDSFVKSLGLNHRYTFLKMDISDASSLGHLFESYKPDHVIHLAAESHVCNSISGPRQFMDTNIMGTFNLLEECRKAWSNYDPAQHTFYHVSTDEVFGELPLGRPDMKFDKHSPIKPRSPYAASKAASDLLVQCYHHTYGMRTIISNCSNNFGPNQHEEKLIPRTIKKMMAREEMTVYGSGYQVRDWLFVQDHCMAIMKAFHSALPGSRHCIGGNNEMTNFEMIGAVGRAVHKFVPGTQLRLKMTNDRPTDDERYAINDKAFRDEFNWAPTPQDEFYRRLQLTVRWYLEREKYEIAKE